MMVRVMEKPKGDVILAKCDAKQHQLGSEEICVLVLCRVLGKVSHLISEPYSSSIK